MLLSILLVRASAGAAPACGLIYPVAPNAAAARRIALAVIASRPHPARRRYVLRVVPTRDDPGRWTAFESLPPPRRAGGPGWVSVQTGGGGVSIRIDRCTGEISQLAYSP
jgi:hypothetical protein